MVSHAHSATRFAIKVVAPHLISSARMLGGLIPLPQSTVSHTIWWVIHPAIVVSSQMIDTDPALKGE